MTPRPPVPAAGDPWFRRLTGRSYASAQQVLEWLARGQNESAAGITVAAVWLLSVPVMLAGCAVDVVRDGGDASSLAASALMMAAAGLVVARLSRIPRSVSAVQLFTGLVTGTGAAVIALMVPHLLTETVTGLDEAFVESAAAVSGTNATVVPPEDLSDGIATVRALTQWAAGAALIVVVVRVLPHLGVGGLDADGGVATRSARRISPRVGGTLYRLLTMYFGFTGLMFVAYVLAGMPTLDSILHGLTTVSTGGFSSRDMSIGGYESAAIEWVATGGMVVAGCSLPLLYLALRRRDPRRFLRSIEFRVYAGLILFTAAAIIGWSDEPMGMDLVRTALFAAASALSTTGFVAEGAADIPAGADMMLVVLMAVGGMAASLAGGFKVVRLMTLVAYIRRELTRSLHPDVVKAVRIGQSSISEIALNRIVGELLLSLMLLGAGLVTLAMAGLDPVGAASFAVSSYSNVGPAFGDDALTGHLSSVNAVGHLTAGMLMLIGRVSVTPVLVTLGAAISPLLRAARFERRRTHADVDGTLR